MRIDDLRKTEPLCGNVFLIDENLCLKTSYPLINYNVGALSSSLVRLDRYGNEFINLYNNFASNSARWITAISNWETLSARWFKAENVVVSLSSYWQKPVNLVYVRSFDLQTYLNPVNTLTYKQQIRTWLNQNFLSNFSENQLITVDLHLTHEFQVDWSFYYSYYESCVPPNTTFSGDCECPKPSLSCNAGTIDGVAFRGCRNAGSYCRQNSNLTFKTGTENVRCPNFNGRTMTVNYIKPFTDKTTARIVSLNFRKVNNVFQII